MTFDLDPKKPSCECCSKNRTLSINGLMFAKLYSVAILIVAIFSLHVNLSYIETTVLNSSFRFNYFNARLFLVFILNIIYNILIIIIRI